MAVILRQPCRLISSNTTCYSSSPPSASSSSSRPCWGARPSSSVARSWEPPSRTKDMETSKFTGQYMVVVTYRITPANQFGNSLSRAKICYKIWPKLQFFLKMLLMAKFALDKSCWGNSSWKCNNLPQTQCLLVKNYFKIPTFPKWLKISYFPRNLRSVTSLGTMFPSHVKWRPAASIAVQ